LLFVEAMFQMLSCGEASVGRDVVAARSVIAKAAKGKPVIDGEMRQLNFRCYL
jgi:hypothetical protein